MNRLALLAALKVAAPALGDDSAPIPALSHFCFEDDTLLAFNDVVAVIVGHKTGLTLGLHGSTLLGVLGSSRADEVDLKVKGSTATLTGAGKVELPVLDKSDFVFTLPEHEPILTVPLSEEVRRALEVCLISVAEDSLRPEYNGVTLRVGKSGTVLFSTDNTTATRFEPKAAKVPARKDAALVLPKVAADLVLKLFQKESKPKITISDKIAVVEFGGEPDVTLVTKLLGTPSMKLDEVFKQHTEGAEPCDLPEGLAMEIEKAIVLTSRESLKEVTLFAGKGELSITVQASLGKMRSVLPLKGKKLAGSVTVSPEYVKRVLPFVTGFSINDERSLVLHAEGLSHIISAVPQASPAAEEGSAQKGK